MLCKTCNSKYPSNITHNDDGSVSHKMISRNQWGWCKECKTKVSGTHSWCGNCADLLNICHCCGKKMDWNKK